MKRFDHILLLLLLTSAPFAGCKKVTVGEGLGAKSATGSGDGTTDPAAAKSGTAVLDDAAALGEEAAAENDDVGGAATAEAPADGEQTLDERFNLVHWIKTRPKLSPLYSYIDAGNTVIAFGDQKFFKIESNGTFGISPDFAKGAAERKLSGIFWMKSYAGGSLLKTAEDEKGYMIDTGADATLDKLSIDMHFRWFGADVASRSVLAGFDQSITRQKDVSINFIPGGFGKATAFIGGEIGYRAEFGIRRDNVHNLNLIYTPHASMQTGASLLVGIIVVETGIRGTIRIVDLLLKGSSTLGFIPGSKLIHFDFGLDPGELKLIDGHLDWVIDAFLVGNVLSKPIWHPAPVATARTPGYATTFTKFLTKPADASTCRTATDAAAQVLAGNVEKLTAYIAEAPEEDKNMMRYSVTRMGLLHRKVQAYCSANY